MNNPKTINHFPSGIVRIPASKSLSHRAVICAGLAAIGGDGQSHLNQLGDSEDIRATLSCMETLGAQFANKGDETLVRKNIKPSNATTLIMDCGESGSTLRFLLPIAALQDKSFDFIGHGRLMKRPLEIYERLFTQKNVFYEKHDHKLSVKGPLTAGEFRLAGNVSSQFVSGLLLALPLLDMDSQIILDTPLESAAYVKLTLDVMRHFDVNILNTNSENYFIPGGQHYKAKKYQVEGDYSQAAFFLAAGALGCSVSCADMQTESHQGDAAIISLLEKMGAEITWQDGILTASSKKLSAIDINVSEIPDLVPVLAVLCSIAEGTSHITGAGRLRMKESDRLHAMSTELTKLGAKVTEGLDSLEITGTPWLEGGAVDAHGDHRIAMAMAVAAIRCKNPVTLTGWQHVNKSYPDFWEDFEKEIAI